MVREIPYKPMSGWLPLFLCLTGVIGGVLLFVFSVDPGLVIGVIGGIALVIGATVSLFGLMAIQPNQARVLLLFGEYKGSVKESGFFWANPFFSKKKVSLRVRNFETGSTEIPQETDASGQVVRGRKRSDGRASKVNDRDGNPIEISAVVVWRVVDTAEALLEVDDYNDYVAIQSESALRNLVSRHPYDGPDDEVSLRGNTDDISHQLRDDIQERLNLAGVSVIEARISHLAYAPEIAATMLRRQQAQAVVAARAKIVEGAVGMVEMALAELEGANIVNLDDERRAAMVSNLLVVLCSDHGTQPVVNTGSLYQ